jgi:hypothetical protein
MPVQVVAQLDKRREFAGDQCGDIILVGHGGGLQFFRTLALS